jgi:CxxC motif-containing protein
MDNKHSCIKNSELENHDQDISNENALVHEIICIACPTGCHMRVAKSADATWSVTGNKCPRGEKYGIAEMTEPKRTVTYVVQTTSVKLPFLPVKTDKPLLKNMISDLLTELSQKKVTTPVLRGDILINNFKDTGVDVVFTRTSL